jgi:hypothetical protein
MKPVDFKLELARTLTEVNNIGNRKRIFTNSNENDEGSLQG